MPAIFATFNLFLERFITGCPVAFFCTCWTVVTFTPRVVQQHYYLPSVVCSLLFWVILQLHSFCSAMLALLQTLLLLYLFCYERTHCHICCPLFIIVLFFLRLLCWWWWNLFYYKLLSQAFVIFCSCWRLRYLRLYIGLVRALYQFLCTALVLADPGRFNIHLLFIAPSQPTPTVALPAGLPFTFAGWL